MRSSWLKFCKKIDHESYAMAYAKYGKKPAIGCAVVLNNGKLPINLLMEL